MPVSYTHLRSVLEGVCITGGEPLLNDTLESFLRTIKELGYQIKLDTNGSYPKRLKELVEKKLIDYVAMDIKNCLKRYPETTGIHNFDVTPIIESAAYLMEDHIPYEFRTTIVKELHTLADVQEIGKWLKDARAYYLQGFVDSERVIQKGLHAYDAQTMKQLQEAVIPYIANTQLRGL